MISSVLKLFPSIFKYSFVFDFEFFCLNFLYLNRLLGSSTVVFFVFCDLDWGEGVTVIYMGSMVMCCYGEYGWGNGFRG